MKPQDEKKSRSQTKTEIRLGRASAEKSNDDAEASKDRHEPLADAEDILFAADRELQ
ncbi:hypothetical protein JXA32_04150 [Candidatus Sumerlaeota bacterium]|nr:hypothetical protein [Candidatus Sumerlaeota bacterium]